MTRAEVDELKSRPGNSCAEVAERLGVGLHRRGREEWAGSCPICSTNLRSANASRWETKDGGRGWVCAVCNDGGDVIRLVEKALGLDFKGAVDWLGGVNSSQGSQAIKARQKAREAEAVKKAKEAERYRERELTALYDVWKRSLDPQGTLVETTLPIAVFPSRIGRA